MICCDVYYSGQVQGVGFRYTSMSIARQYAVTGYVQNLPDGRVRLIAEGPADEVEGLLHDVADRMQDLIRNVHCERIPPTGQFTQFEIRR